MSGPPLGRPPANISEETKKQAKVDEKIRNLIGRKTSIHYSSTIFRALSNGFFTIFTIMSLTKMNDYSSYLIFEFLYFKLTQMLRHFCFYLLSRKSKFPFEYLDYLIERINPSYLLNFGPLPSLSNRRQIESCLRLGHLFLVDILTKT